MLGGTEELARTLCAKAVLGIELDCEVIKTC